MFSLYSLNSVTKICHFSKGAQTATFCIRDQDATTAPARQMWQTGFFNWSQFMLQWFIRFPEFTKFTESQLNLGKTPITFTKLSTKRRNYAHKADWIINYKMGSIFLCSFFLPEKVKLTTFWKLKSSPSRRNCIKIVIDFYASAQVLVEVLNKDKKVQEAYMKTMIKNHTNNSRHILLKCNKMNIFLNVYIYNFVRGIRWCIRDMCFCNAMNYSRQFQQGWMIYYSL